MRKPKIILYSFVPDEIRPILKRYGLRELPPRRDAAPDLVVSYGGDGTFFNAERDWPGVPKVILRRSRVCPTCLKNVPRQVLRDLAEKDWRIVEIPKIAFSLNLTESIATNDIILRNWNPNQALRFAFDKVRGARVPRGEIIGDGFVLATPIGAGAYYQSITRRRFSSAFGLAFNNPTKPLKPIDLRDDFEISVKILRENGLLCLDNLPSFWFLRSGETFVIRKHEQKTRLLELGEYYCVKCREELA